MEEIINLKNLNQNCGSKAFLRISVIDPSKPLILVCPGGAYEHISSRENQPVQNKFNSLGYNTAFLHYSCYPESFPIPYIDIETSFNYLRPKFNKIFLMGFSAGGHLSALFATSEYAKKIDGIVLCYPVISMSKYFHEYSRSNFFGENNTPENWEKYSVENRVTKDFPQTFIWATKTDASVPYENSLMLVEKLKENGVKVETKFFDQGRHGLALADETAIRLGDRSYFVPEVQIWPDLVDKFLKSL